LILIYRVLNYYYLYLVVYYYFARNTAINTGLGSVHSLGATSKQANKTKKIS